MSYVPLSGLSLRDIEYVVAVDDLRNFSRAAERCGVSQAGLSEQVRKLEQLLDVTLFERSRRHVAPTPDGERLIALGRDVLAAARNLLEVARARTSPLDGILRLGVIPTLGPYYIPGILPHLRNGYPNLQLRLTEGMTDTLVHALRNNELDLALMALPAPSDALETIPLFEEAFLGVFPATHELSGKNKISLKQLGRPDLLLLEDGHCLRDQALSICPTVPRQREPRLATSLEMLWHMIGAGEGFSLIPKLALRNRMDFESLITIRPLSEPEASRTIGLAWRASDPRASTFRELGKFLRQNTPDGCKIYSA
ncbi:transcriptional regulator LysR/OxyR [Gluconobacter thailandicus F149-1 = NBRC 100600]|uniref:Hydrogen peroxide-inducible genes activator n=3 Tax=Gluconobacter thailandicus TaxID=257438 RepID=A0AAP9JH36_GLUTH|nr:hydrogen peroxide-inducible genes activator [Gluconobacter thailandicus]AFW01130.1 oxidative stress regulatory protein OxyR [Gluconobacter oxydans H24]ANQ40236.1 LysR family transcriptional regulator [Gluconobacter oxydans]QEH95435.1 hydrogen peroxide-inducible genes activator [Gluconobacter thailandicus]GAC86346.1 oxidative stress regulatory protein OxyR [Gluconobacter thailandicus NBRC 3255]GAD25907.1 oxidative stress regulatory protein OxyR [Gluconobacter thailandicus NBRC 3257]